MTRWLVVLLLACLMPAFAADAPAPDAQPEPPPGSKRYVLISMEDAVSITELLQRMTAKLQEQDEEIRRLRDRPANQSCI